MPHKRQSIRDDIVTTLTGLTTTGTNVFQSRVYPIQQSVLPGLLIYTSRETSDYQTMLLARTVVRTLEVTIEAFVKGLSGYDNTIDTISAEIEAAIYADTTLGGNALDVLLTEIEVKYSGEGDQPVALGVMTLEVMYVTDEGSPTV